MAQEATALLAATAKPEGPAAALARYDLAAVLAELDDSVAIVGADGCYHFWNKGAEALFGFSADEALGQHLSLVQVGGDTTEMQTLLDRALAGESIEPFDAVRRRKDGSTIELSVVVSSIRDADGKVEAIAVIARDITEQRRASRELEQGEERYRRITALTPSAVIVHVDGKIVFANPAATAMFGAAVPEDLVGRNVMDLVHPDEHGRVLESRQTLEVGETTPPLEARRLRIDGTEFETEAIGTGYIWDDKPAFLVVIRDITEQREAERRITESEQRYRAIATLSPNALLVHIDGTILFVNPAAVQMFGADDADQLIGRDTLDLVHPDDHAKTLTFRAAVVRGEITPLAESVFLRLDGTPFDAETTGGAIPWNGRRAMLAVIRDISERKHAARLLAESEERYRQITALTAR